MAERRAAERAEVEKNEPPEPEQPPEPRDATRAEKEEIVYLNPLKLFPFKDHPLGAWDDAEMKGLMESVNSKSRSIPLKDDVVLHLRKYLQLFHPEENQYSAQYFFNVIRNRANKRMTEDNVRQPVSKYGRKAREICKEVPEKVHPHLL